MLRRSVLEMESGYMPMGVVIEVTSEKRRAEWSGPGVGLSIVETKTNGVAGPGVGAVPSPSVTRMNGEEGRDEARRGEDSSSSTRFSARGLALENRRFVRLIERKRVRGRARVMFSVSSV
jgi:hypothetical protein